MKSTVLDKITKMLRLAACKGATEGEVAAALAKAREVARRHDIDIASIDLDADDKKKKSGPEIGKTTVQASNRFYHAYYDWIFVVLRQVFDVHSVVQKAGRRLYAVHFVGTELDVGIACALFPYLEKLFPRILGEHVKSGSLDRSFANQNGCYRGIAIGIIEANKREEEKMSDDDKSKWALVVRDKHDAIEDAKKNFFEDMQEAKKSRKSHSARATQLGYSSGKRVNLRQIQS